MKKILFSLAIIAVVGAIGFGATRAYFSDTETSTGNTFTAGTIDIAVNSPQVWQYALNDMKPGYVDYTNFIITNSGNNPVNVTKAVTGITPEENGVNEPECAIYGGSWSGTVCTGGVAKNDLENVVTYDLSVVVKDGSGVEKWNQVLYNENKTLAEIQAIGPMFLGMIPTGWTMEVTESYHMLATADNNYQSDKMTFNIELVGEQLKGSVVLENKDTTNWQVLGADTLKGTLSYDVKGPKFKYTFSGIAPLANTSYVLAAGYNGSSNVDTYLGTATSASDGTISFSGDLQTGDMKNVKVWLLPTANWNSGTILWSGMGNWLWETGMIWYEDTDL